MTTQSAIFAASVLGTLAFKEGRKSIPAHDPELLKVIEQHDLKEIGDCIPILKAWASAWDAANLA